MKVKGETWNTHQWFSNPRRLAVESSNAVLQHHCILCVETSSPIHLQTVAMLSSSLQ